MLSSIVVAFPLASAIFVVLVAAISLLLSGIASIILGLRGRKNQVQSGNTASRGSRALSVVAGALAIAYLNKDFLKELF
jgi:Short repeat of unknown function (DUF308)